MSRTNMKWAVFTAIFTLAFSISVWSADPIASNAPSVTLNATEPESISVTLGGVDTVNFSDLSSVVNGDNPVSWTTDWNLDPANHDTVDSCIYFASANALTGGANSQDIPTSSVLGQPGASGSFSAISGSACGETNALQISSTAITTSNNNNGQKADSVALRIDPSGLGLAPGDYTGTLYIVSYANFLGL